MAHVRTSLILAAGLAASAGPPGSPDPDALVRAGNAAFRRGDLGAADRAYAAAAERTADPGLVAFNRAAVLARQGDLRTAEGFYLRALDDRAAPPGRRARALYDRGVCVLARGGSAAVYRTAIACFEQCLDVESGDDPLAADARHNLELAKLLWAAARAEEKKLPRPDDVPLGTPPDPPPGSGMDPGGGTDPGPEPGGSAAVTPEPVAGQAPKGPPPRETTRKAPGAGSLPVVLDPDDPRRLAPDDARALLRRAADRLDTDRRANARLLAGPERPHVRDW